jgi:hypothetical protein
MIEQRNLRDDGERQIEARAKMFTAARCPFSNRPFEHASVEAVEFPVLARLASNKWKHPRVRRLMAIR